MTTSVLSLPAAAPIQPGSRVFRIQLGDMTDGDVTETPAATEPPSDGINTPQSGDSDPLPSSEANMSLGNAAEAAEATEAVDVPNSIYRQAPDEKLLEAMQSPRDRLFLLRLEKDVMDFVQLSK